MGRLRSKRGHLWRHCGSGGWAAGRRARASLLVRGSVVLRVGRGLGRRCCGGSRLWLLVWLLIPTKALECGHRQKSASRSRSSAGLLWNVIRVSLSSHAAAPCGGPFSTLPCTCVLQREVGVTLRAPIQPVAQAGIEPVLADHVLARPGCGCSRLPIAHRPWRSASCVLVRSLRRLP